MKVTVEQYLQNTSLLVQTGQHVVYMLTCSVNNKLYIGITNNLEKRVKRHCHNKTVQLIGKSILKHGTNSFFISLLGQYKSRYEASTAEKNFIESKISLFPVGYNLTTGGENNYVHLDVTKQLISLKGRDFFASLTPEEINEYHKNRSIKSNITKYGTPVSKLSRRELTKDLILVRLSYDPGSGIFKDNKTGKILGTKDKTNQCPYIGIRLYGNLYDAHTLSFVIMQDRFPERGVCHINGNSFDNRWVNLKEIKTNVPTIKSFIKKPKNSNLSLPRFVYKGKKENTYQVKIGSLKICLGIFLSLEDAILKRNHKLNELGIDTN